MAWRNPPPRRSHPSRGPRALRLGAVVVAAALGAALAGAMAPPVGHAEPAPDLARARELYRSAEAAMQDGRYDDAARDYGAAYELSSDPALFYKIGHANERAGKCDVALVYYARYLRDGKPTEQFTALTQERIAACGGGQAGTGSSAGSGSASGAPSGAGNGSAPSGPTGGTGSGAAGSAGASAPTGGAVAGSAAGAGTRAAGSATRSASSASAGSAAGAASSTGRAGPEPAGASAGSSPSGASSAAASTGAAGADGGAASSQGPASAGPAAGSGSAAAALIPPTREKVAYLLGGGALALVTLGGVLAYAASSSENDVRDLYAGFAGQPPPFDAQTRKRYDDLVDEGRRYQHLAWAAFGLAGAAAVGVAVLFTVGRGDEPAPPRATPTVTPVVGPRGAGVSVRF